jgi:ATP adenylyltransferase
VTTADKEERGCFLCDKAASRDDRKGHIIHRGATAFVLLNTFPYNTGHLMVAPYRHTGEIDDLSDDQLLEMMRLAAWSRRMLRSAMHPDGCNWGLNLGRSAGAGIVDHLHLHVVPRWAGDTNFMTVTAATKVMPHSLDEVWEQLRCAAADLGAP